MTNITYSVNDVPIRLTDERWTHIVENHDDIAGYYFEVLYDFDKVFVGEKIRTQMNADRYRNLNPVVPRFILGKNR